MLMIFALNLANASDLYVSPSGLDSNSDIEDDKIKADAPPAQLYNLEKDLNQTKNLYNLYPEKVKQMKVLLKSYQAEK